MQPRAVSSVVEQKTLNLLVGVFKSSTAHHLFSMRLMKGPSILILGPFLLCKSGPERISHPRCECVDIEQNETDGGKNAFLKTPKPR